MRAVEGDCYAPVVHCTDVKKQPKQAAHHAASLLVLDCGISNSRLPRGTNGLFHRPPLLVSGPTSWCIISIKILLRRCCSGANTGFG